MTGDCLAMRRTPALGVCSALACVLLTAAPAVAGNPGPDPSPAPTPDPYSIPAPAPRSGFSGTVAPVQRRQARVPAPSRHSAVTTPARKHAGAARQAPQRSVPQPPQAALERPISRSGSVQALAVAVKTHHLSRTLALAVALLVLLSGTFVLTAAREVAR